MPGYAFFLVAGAMLLVAVGTILAGRLKHAKTGESNSDALGFIGGVLNALFIVVLAFYTVITWTEADLTEQHASTESAELIEIYWQVASVPPAERDQIRALVREYTTEVAERDWPRMNQHQENPKADDLLVALRSEITRLPVQDDQIAAAREQSLQNIRTVADERRARIEQATGDSALLRLLLLGTIIGGIMMVAFPLLIGFSATLRNVLCVVLLGGILGFTMYFALELDQPFHGMIKVEPDAYRSALIEYQRIP